jgi:TonB family protein
MRNLLVAGMVLTSATASLPAQSSRPEPTAFVELNYPKEALEARVQGTVILAVTTDANGRVTEVQSLAGPAVLATAASANARQWTLTMRGRSDALVYRFEIDHALCEDDTRSLFRLRGRNLAAITACSARGRQGAPEAVGDLYVLPMSFAPPPSYPQIAQNARVEGAVVLDLSIDAKGDVLEARALNELPLLDRTAVEHARTWKFYPSEKAHRRGAFVYEFAFDSQKCWPEPQVAFWRVADHYYRLSTCLPTVNPQR